MTTVLVTRAYLRKYRTFEAMFEYIESWYNRKSWTCLQAKSRDSIGPFRIFPWNWICNTM